MAIQKHMCVNHSDRPAICVCVITKEAICAECSTRYEGVNYSKEGLVILKQRRAEASAKTGKGHLVLLAAILVCPLLLYAHYLFFHLSSSVLVDLQQFDLANMFGA